jgi:DNA-binding transcriptional MerR regulator
MSVVKKSSKAKNDEIVIPEKLYFRIGEVARLCKLPAYVLRFWETEFPQLKPGKSDTGQRMYRRRDLENILRIKQLLYDEGYTIAGARQQLRAEMKTKPQSAALPFPVPDAAPGLRRVKQGLQEILGILSVRQGHSQSNGRPRNS